MSARTLYKWSHISFNNNDDNNNNNDKDNDNDNNDNNNNNNNRVATPENISKVYKKYSIQFISTFGRNIKLLLQELGHIAIFQ